MSYFIKLFKYHISISTPVILTLNLHASFHVIVFAIFCFDFPMPGLEFFSSPTEGAEMVLMFCFKKKIEQIIFLNFLFEAIVFFICYSS